jgi:sugar lactone lactonase YvrE
MTVRAQHLLATACIVGEGPLQHSSGDLLWVDIERHQLFRWDRRGEPAVETFDEPIGAVAETTTRELLVAGASGLWLVDAAAPPRLLIPLPDAAPEMRMNDGKADPSGRFVGGTMRRRPPREPVATLWSFADGNATELVTGVRTSNGLAWSEDGSTLFFIDTPTQRVDAFDYALESGAVANRRTVVEVPAAAGKPDGMCIDDEGGLWVALWGGGAVHRYVGAELTEIVEVPTPYVTCPIFATPTRDQLVITTASEPFEGDAPAGAGDLYLADVGVTGSPPYLADVAVVVGAESDRRSP